MTRLLQPPTAIAVEMAGGAPARITAGPVRGPLEPIGRWVVEQDWWDAPVAREYWKAILGGRMLVELFHDRDGGGWFLERVYD